MHAELGLTPPVLRTVSQHQVGLLVDAIEALDLDPALARVEAIPPGRRGGFVAIRSPHAEHLSRELRRREVFTDFRGDVLRLGPAPYLSDDQLRDVVVRLHEAIGMIRFAG